MKNGRYEPLDVSLLHPFNVAAILNDSMDCQQLLINAGHSWTGRPLVEAVQDLIRRYAALEADDTIRHEAP